MLSVRRPVVAQTVAGLRALLVFTVICGILYPAVVLGLAQLPGLKPRADGSLLTDHGRPVGSSLIGQSFTDAAGQPLMRYFQSRPSAGGYDPTASGASNLGPESPDLLSQVCARSAAVGALEGVSGARPYCADGAGTRARGGAPADPAVPADAVTASGSGLDPDISPAYARLQERRVAAARGLPVDTVRRLVEEHTTGRTLGFLGEPVVNVVELNLALDQL
ncbi:potassium-transporting ATPase subunit C [Spongisporangium articulatum]|uniref:Potassium-transporting ATPase KdpC subunit n=1 Tax=Spongisporangium articulatum TaxID=3362603 RepID=A0ABW8AQL6_9ACTN